MIDGYPVLDAVVHPYNLDSSNFANKWAQGLCDMLAHGSYAISPPGYKVPYDAYARDWSIEEVANMSFLEGHADLAVNHVLPIGTFKDGLCSVEKAVECRERWPERFVATYAGVDPMLGEAALEEMERQFEILAPVGLKLYPNSWQGEEVKGWLMDDPEIAFPLFERAQQLGIKAVAIHKALPLGPAPMEHYKVDDIDRAALTFPDLNFEVVHGGMAFVEETAWQLARYPNVYVNLETTGLSAAVAPLRFEEVMATFVRTGGPLALTKLLWGSGAMVAHPRPVLEAFVRDFAFSEEMLARGGVIPIGPEEKRAILAGNYAAMVGLDLEQCLAAAAGDSFASRLGDDGAPLPPYSTTTVADRVE